MALFLVHQGSRAVIPHRRVSFDEVVLVSAPDLAVDPSQAHRLLDRLTKPYPLLIRTLLLHCDLDPLRFTVFAPQPRSPFCAILEFLGFGRRYRFSRYQRLIQFALRRLERGETRNFLLPRPVYFLRWWASLRTAASSRCPHDQGCGSARHIPGRTSHRTDMMRFRRLARTAL